MDAMTKGQVPEPDKLTFQLDRTRRSILGSYWALILLALPLWWYTTDIPRLSLPTARVEAQAEKTLHFPINVVLEGASQHVVSQTQNELNQRASANVRLWEGLDVQVSAGSKADEAHGSYSVGRGKGKPTIRNRRLNVPPSATPLQVADILSSLLVPYSTLPEQEQHVIQYAPQYRIAFTLLNEDAAAGAAVTKWDAPGAIARFIFPILDNLSTLHNFTIESQAQFHGPLVFEPTTLSGEYGLTSEDLTVFVNSAEWTLSSSVSNDPVLHFVLFIPSSSRRPLHILTPQGKPFVAVSISQIDVLYPGTKSNSNAFILPQWGGIYIFNPQSESSTLQLTSDDLKPIFSTFAGQLLGLLGVPPLPHTVQLTVNPSTVLSDWQLDAILRRRALENTRETQSTLMSIIRVVQQIESMPVLQDVKGDIQDALVALDKVYKFSSKSLPQAMRHSSQAFTLASRAFFNPGMLALLYFPAEHKTAVYAPLFASAGVPLIVAALREFKAWRQRRRERAQAKLEKRD